MTPDEIYAQDALAHAHSLYLDLKQTLENEREAREQAEAEVARLREWERHTVEEGMRGASRYWENRWRDEAAAREKAEAALSAISSVIGRRVGCEFMDPPDGGDVSLAEQVSRLIDAREKAEAERDEAKAEAAILHNPPALHVALLRGHYLTPAQLLHLGGEAAQIAVAEARNAALREAAADLKKHGHDFAAIRVRNLIADPSND